ncbi:hypothetical protein EDE15_4267 [Edaphobacter aggregans]|uniref:Uncharacterized protein n=1 Tax=Edaphobacter aggregans TaxID=570835 RepID=A0A3R9QKG0_9BACT|nr:hypothetical protein EDE15_4267 [Edaphobacter aggregans]
MKVLLHFGVLFGTQDQPSVAIHVSEMPVIRPSESNRIRKH